MHKHLTRGDLQIPNHPRGLVIFAHGSGSSRLSPRNRFVAKVLNDAGFATYLFDLLTEDEDSVYENRFDIPLLSQRLLEATEWIMSRSSCKGLPLGYFGASTGSAAALSASVDRPEVLAIVSRGGRPDMAESALSRIIAATLLLVGGLDTEVLELNKQAFTALSGQKKLSIIPGASHLFEESGALEKVANQAKEWFLLYLK